LAVIYIKSTNANFAHQMSTSEFGHHTMAKSIKVSVISEQENGALQNM